MTYFKKKTQPLKRVIVLKYKKADLKKNRSKYSKNTLSEKVLEIYSQFKNT
jgi:hypothetical protein